jgi:hypothetical protein
MIKLLDQKNYIFMDEYYVLYFYQMKPKIYIMLRILYLIYIWYIINDLLCISMFKNIEF